LIFSRAALQIASSSTGSTNSANLCFSPRFCNHFALRTSGGDSPLLVRTEIFSTCFASIPSCKFASSSLHSPAPLRSTTWAAKLPSHSSQHQRVVFYFSSISASSFLLFLQQHQRDIFFSFARSASNVCSQDQRFSIQISAPEAALSYFDLASCESLPFAISAPILRPPFTPRNPVSSSRFPTGFLFSSQTLSASEQSCSSSTSAENFSQFDGI